MSIHHTPPPFFRRIRAFAYDYLLIAGYLILLTGASLLLVRGPLGETWRVLTSSAVSMDLVAFCTTILPVVLYFTLMESSRSGATWGKQRTGLRVVRVNGERLGRGRALIRSALKFLPWQIAHTCLFHIPGWPMAPQAPPNWVMVGFVLVWVLVGLYLATMAAGPQRRTPYDWAAASQVILRDVGPDAVSVHAAAPTARSI